MSIASICIQYRVCKTFIYKAHFHLEKEENELYFLSGMNFRISSTLQESILQISFKVAVEIFLFCFKESRVPRLNPCSLINV